MCVFSGFFVFQANFGPSFGHRISDLQEVPNPLFHCFLQWICNTSEVGVRKRTRGFRSAGLFMPFIFFVSSELALMHIITLMSPGKGGIVYIILGFERTFF